MVITLERDLPKLTAITEEFLEDMDMAATVITLERDLLKLTATMEESLEDTVTADTVDTSSENRSNLIFIFLFYLILFCLMFFLFDTSNFSKEVIELKICK